MSTSSSGKLLFSSMGGAGDDPKYGVYNFQKTDSGGNTTTWVTAKYIGSDKIIMTGGQYEVAFAKADLSTLTYDSSFYRTSPTTQGQHYSRSGFHIDSNDRVWVSYWGMINNSTNYRRGVIGWDPAGNQSFAHRDIEQTSLGSNQPPFRGSSCNLSQTDPTQGPMLVGGNINNGGWYSWGLMWFLKNGTSQGTIEVGNYGNHWFSADGLAENLTNANHIVTGSPRLSNSSNTAEWYVGNLGSTMSSGGVWQAHTTSAQPWSSPDYVIWEHNGSVVDPSGDIFTMAYATGSGSNLVGGSHYGPVAVVKLNGTTGAAIWQRQIGTFNASNNIIGGLVQTDSSGNLYNTVYDNNNSRLHVLKWDTNGNLLWQWHVTGAYFGKGNALTFDDDGDIVLGGSCLLVLPNDSTPLTGTAQNWVNANVQNVTMSTANPLPISNNPYTAWTTSTSMPTQSWGGTWSENWKNGVTGYTEAWDTYTTVSPQLTNYPFN